MPEITCLEAMALLNTVFSSGLIFNDGHEIFARLQAGDDTASIVADFGRKFGQPESVQPIRDLVAAWPPLHVEAVSRVVEWALSKLDTEDRVMIRWKGDATSPDTVTRFELRDHQILIEFAHPPVGVPAGVS